MPEKKMVVAGGKPVRTGTRNVAPNIASTCWPPTPIVAGQDSRSSGATTSSGPSCPCRTVQRVTAGEASVNDVRTLVVDHPLVAHKLTALRDARTESPTFRRLADELVTLLAYEATRDVRVVPVEVTTPVAVATGFHLDRPLPLVVPVLRA